MLAETPTRLCTGSSYRELLGTRPLGQASLRCFSAFPRQRFLAVAQKLLCRSEMEAVNINLAPPHFGGESETEQPL